MAEWNTHLGRRDFIKAAGTGAAGLALLGTSTSGAAASTVKNGMGYRTLGRTGLEISEVILGAGPMTPGRANLLRAALSQGVNYIDTAWGYGKGQSEIAVGQVVKSMGNRDKLLIATKASSVNHNRLLDAGASEVEKAIQERLEESLTRLQTDYVDVYFAPHGASKAEQVAYPALREAMEKLKEEGKIRFTALSTHTDYGNVALAAVESGFYDVLMPVICGPTLVPKYSAAAKEAQNGGGRPIFDMREVVKKAHEKNIGIISMKAAKSGFNPEGIHEMVKSDLAKDQKLSFHQVAYRFVLDQPEVHGVNIGMSNMLHLREALVLPSVSLSG